VTDVQDARETDVPAPRRRRRWAFWTGVGLLLAGLGVLGWVGWQLYGTTWVAQKRHAETVQTLEREWSQPPDRARAEVETDHGTATAILRVPAFGDDFAVPILEGVSDDVLASGMGHFTGSAGPGEVGNYVLTGHRVTHGEPLRDLPDLQPGDEIVVETRDAVYTYVLDTGGDDLRVPFTAGWVTGSHPVNPDGGVGPPPDQRRLVTLATCAELFHTDDRLVAFGHLQDVVRR
jgi:sortase A